MGKSAICRLCLVLVTLLLWQASPVAAFGAGNIASISKIEGRNWRHGDIEDMLETVAFIKGHKWTSMMIKRVYFGNWLRDYSQAVDVGTLKGVPSGTIRILVWVLSFLSFGYATGEFEVTEERLGVYRPEEHIDNPKDYASNEDARQYDPRLRPPVHPLELEIDPQTGMKNYIANERLGVPTSAGYVKHSLTRSIHFGRVYTSGTRATKGKEADLCEALRCLGQGLHCLEDFGAHTNYTELALRELGFRNVFPHTGTATMIDLQGRQAFPLVTGTFGAVDFLHSVLGEATDHFAQTEIEELDIALKEAQAQSKKSTDHGARGFGRPAGKTAFLTSLLSQVPGAGLLCQQAEQLQAQSDAQERAIQSDATSESMSYYGNTRESRLGTRFGASQIPAGDQVGSGTPLTGPKFDPVKMAAQIYPILEFRDKVVKIVSATIEKIPGLEVLVEKITETVTLFVLSLLAPFIRPIINTVSDQLKAGSSSVVDASGQHQYEPWTDPHCSDPTHSLLSKDHFSNILNEPAGKIASTILQYVAPRVFYAWENIAIPVDQVLDDVVRVFHHPALRDHKCELHSNMFRVVEQWAHSLPDQGADLNNILSSDGVRQGRNLKGLDGSQTAHNHGGIPSTTWEKLSKIRASGANRDDMDVDDATNSLADTTVELEGDTAYDITGSAFCPRVPTPTQQSSASTTPRPPPEAVNQGPYLEPSYHNDGIHQHYATYGESSAPHGQGYSQPYEATGPFPPRPSYEFNSNSPLLPPAQQGGYGYEGYEGGSAPPPQQQHQHGHYYAERQS